MLSTARGCLPNSTIDASRSGSADSLPLPPTRSVSSMPGTKKISCTKPEPSTILRKLSIRLLPERSGISNWFGPATWTKPGLPPRGEASTLPSEPDVASTLAARLVKDFLRMKFRPAYQQSDLPSSQRERKCAHRGAARSAKAEPQAHRHRPSRRAQRRAPQGDGSSKLTPQAHCVHIVRCGAVCSNSC